MSAASTTTKRPTRRKVKKFVNGAMRDLVKRIPRHELEKLVARESAAAVSAQDRERVLEARRNAANEHLSEAALPLTECRDRFRAIRVLTEERFYGSYQKNVIWAFETAIRDMAIAGESEMRGAINRVDECDFRSGVTLEDVAALAKAEEGAAHG